jgi:hypothetical protein
MSYTEMYVAFEDGDFHLESEFKNAHGGAMFVWDVLIDKYKVPGEKYSFGNEEDAFKNLWNLPDETFRAWEHNTLKSTYDNVCVLREHMLVLADSLDMFEEALKPPNRVCSLKDQARAIREHHKNGARALAWNQTSVCGDPLWRGEYDEESEEYTPFNLDTGEGHWSFEPKALT